MNISANILINTLKDKRYKLFGDGKTNLPFDLNIIAVSSEESITANTFNDVLCVLYKDKPNTEDWVLDLYSCTTAPGLWEIQKPSFPAAQIDGVCVIAEGQYSKAFTLGIHGSGRLRHEALIQTNPLNYYRYKQSYGDPLKYREVGVKQNSQIFGTNIHRATPDNLTTSINNWSAGCIVLADDRGPYHKFISTCKKQGYSGLGRIFTLTVLRESELCRT